MHLGSPLAHAYERFAATGTSPLHARIALAVSESVDALRAIEASPARQRRPAVILAAHPATAVLVVAIVAMLTRYVWRYSDVAGGAAHVPAGTVHAYRNVTEAHFLTIVSKGNAAKFFAQVANEVEMSPPDIPGIARVGGDHGITFAR